MHPPTTPKEVHAFLGLVGYYGKFFKDFGKIAKPLTLLTQQQVKFEWIPAIDLHYTHVKLVFVLCTSILHLLPLDS